LTLLNREPPKPLLKLNGYTLDAKPSTIVKEK
jgi:hypothetical protein